MYLSTLSHVSQGGKLPKVPQYVLACLGNDWVRVRVSFVVILLKFFGIDQSCCPVPYRSRREGGEVHRQEARKGKPRGNFTSWGTWGGS